MGRIRRTRWWICLIALAVLCPLGCRPRAKPGKALQGGPVVRIRILEAQQQVTLKADAPPTATISPNGKPRTIDVPKGASVTIELIPGKGWRFGDTTLGAGELIISSPEVGALSINDQAYRGRYRLVPRADGAFDVINDVDIDSYLKSVVSKELLWNWHPEAYRAQAISARTYAIYEWRMASSRGTRSFDLHADQRSQVYGGLAAESAKSQAAVDDTLGVVVAFGPAGQERIFKAYFSSCCGGVRLSSADGFNEPHGAMVEQSVGSLCNDSPRFNWPPVILKKDELTRRFRAWGERRGRPEKNMGRINRIEVQASNPYGRPVRFLVTDTRGNRYSLGAEEIRWAVNTDAAAGTTLYSSFFKPVNEADAIHFVDGHGWGHGVGMCQWCAQAQATQNMAHEDIVLAAYPGSRLVRAY